MAGVAVVDALRRLGVDAALKWPNDVLIAQAKVGGILIESAVDGDRLDYVVVGVGLNVLQTPGELPPTEYPATSVLAATGLRLDRGVLAAALLAAFEETYRIWLDRGTSIFSRWRDALVTLDREVVATLRDTRVQGRAVDVDPDGALVLETGPGERRRIVSGEASLRG